MNHLYPPFNDVRARRAILMAMSQEDYMRAIVGDDNALWKPLPGFFTPGTPLYTEEGGEILKGPRNLDAAKKLLAESGLHGSAGHLPGGAGPVFHQSPGGHHGRSAQAPRHERRFRRDRLGNGGRAPRAENTARPRRLADVPHLACRGRLREPRGLDRGTRQWRQGLVRLARHSRRSRSEITAWFEAKLAGRGENRDRAGSTRPRSTV